MDAIKGSFFFFRGDLKDDFASSSRDGLRKEIVKLFTYQFRATFANDNPFVC